MTDIPVQRLTLVGPVPPPAGGMANQTRQLRRLLESEGVDVELVPVNPPYRPGWVAGVRGVRALARLADYLPRLWRATGRSQMVHVMANSGWSWHLYAAPAVWIARLRGVPAVVNYRGGEAAQFFQKAFRWVRPTLEASAAILVPSDYLREVFAAHGVVVEVVPNIIDTERFPRRHPAVDEDLATAPHIVVCRNLEQIYGIDTAIRSFALVKQEVPGARLTIAGEGPQRAALQALAISLGLGRSVTFTGRLDVSAMADLYQQADIFLNTSRVDNMPNSLLEAMACGVPVVSSDVGGIPHIAEHERSALLVPPDDAPAAAREILRLIRDPGLRARLSDRAWSSVQDYVWPQVRKQLFSVYRAAALN